MPKQLLGNRFLAGAHRGQGDDSRDEHPARSLNRVHDVTNRKNILTTAALVMVCLAAIITATETSVSYDIAMRQKKADLQAIVRREALVIKSIFMHDSDEHSPDDRSRPTSMMTCPQCLTSVDLVKEILREGGNLKSGQGKGVEFVVGSRDGDAIRLLLRRDRDQRQDSHEPSSVPWVSDLAEPMHLALSNLSGTIEAKDYRGKAVLAAYAPVKLLGWGVVAKIDMTELRAPFVTAVRNSFALAVLAILVGLVVLRKQLQPLIQESQDSEEQALAELTRQKYALDEHSIVSVTDPSGKITYANNKFCRISQYSLEELIGHSHRIVNSGHHPRTLWAEAWRTIAKGNVWQGEVCNRANDGTLYWVNATIVPFKDKAERILQHVAIRTDITARKMTEDALIKAKIAADDANRAKSEFLANMSHEICTPMTAILGFAETIAENVAKQENIDAIATVRKNGENLLGIINDILDLSKVEAGKMVVEQVRFKPILIVEDVASLMRVRADAKGLAFDIEYIGAIPETIQSDPTRLRQILINMIGNAVKFTENGSVKLIVRFVDAIRGDRAQGPKEASMQFDVLDTGLGKSDEQAAILFQPFTQADTSTTRKFGGTGLGLTISKRFAELLGGDISLVDSEVGVGTRFRATAATGLLDGVKTLEAPMSTTEVANIAGDVAPVLPSDLQGLRILLAEDGPDKQRLISFVLEKAGADVTIKENGRLAVDAALAARDEGKPFDCILMDMQMPVMDGYEAAGQLRRKGYSAPVIALTAHAMASDREKCINAGCDGYATKPIDRKKLIETIQEQLQQAAAPAGASKPDSWSCRKAILFAIPL